MYLLCSMGSYKFGGNICMSVCICLGEGNAMKFMEMHKTEKVSTSLLLPTFATQVQWWWMPALVCVCVCFYIFIFLDHYFIALSFFVCLMFIQWCAIISTCGVENYFIYILNYGPPYHILYDNTLTYTELYNFDKNNQLYSKKESTFLINIRIWRF